MKRDPDEIATIMAPYRRRIDEIDAQIIDLLRKRYDVIEEVGALKYREHIDPVLPDRVDEVRERAGTLAEERNLDGDFIRRLYAQLIEHSCDLEHEIIARLKAEANAA